ncbi:uncharacterized protein LODBEIA_P32430 [Lodderomyces beijingensis]|uniref:Zn(2)-C6 fungal-type domain-containing protein n=1 Tax=Lodderomyces beijingensis TaxID=1775926 RepID=A0ABP0ZM81_9ASCO
MRKRHRTVLSCDRCRTRKIKCISSGQQQPCETCVRLKKECTYTKSMETIEIARLKKQNKKKPQKNQDPNVLPSLIDPSGINVQALQNEALQNEAVPRERERKRERECVASTQPSAESSPNSFQEILQIKCKIAELEKMIDRSGSDGLEAEAKSNGANGVNGANRAKSARVQMIPAGEINFSYCFKDWKPLPLSHRPFPYMLLMRRDSGAKLIWQYMVTKANKKRNIFDFSQLLIDLPEEKMNELRTKARIVFGEAYVPGTDEPTVPQDLSRLKAIIGMNDRGLTFVPPGIDFNDPISSYFNLIPPAWVNKKLLNIFFKQLYPFVPIIDELEFRSTLNRIMGPELNDNYMNTFPNVDSSNDLAILAIHLIMLRLAYLSLLDMKGQGSSPLVAHPVSFDAFRAAETIMKEFDFSRRQSLPILQAGLMLRVYLIMSPENIITGAATQITMGSIIQLCYSIGLNRDPECYNHKSAKDLNLKRKIWHYIVMMDILNSLVFNTTLSTDVETSDCRLPEFSSEGANCSDLRLENDVITSFHRYSYLFQLSRKLASFHLQVNKNIRVEEVIQLLSDIEVERQRTLGKSSKFIFSQASSGFLALLNLKIFIQVSFILAYTYFTLYSYYEALDVPHYQTEFFKKTMYIFLKDLEELNTFLFHSQNQNAEILVLAPFAQTFLHFSAVVFGSLRMRLNCNIKLLEQNGDISQLHTARKLVSQLRIFNHCQTKLIGDISTRYRYSLMLRRVHLTVFRMMEQGMCEMLDSRLQTLYETSALRLPRDILERFSQLLESHIPNLAHRHGDLFEPTDEELVMELQRENLWKQLKKIQTEEMLTSSWIDKTKRFHRLTSDFELNYFNFNLDFLNLNEPNFFKG